MYICITIKCLNDLKCRFPHNIMRGGEEGVQSQILKKNRSKYLFLNKIMTNS